MITVIHLSEPVKNYRTVCDKVTEEALMSQGSRAMPQLFFSPLFSADNIHYNFKTCQASKAMLRAPNIPAQNRI